MLNNYFADDEYHPSNLIYTHPIYRHSLHLGDMSSALDTEFLTNHQIRTGNHLVTQSSLQPQLWNISSTNLDYKSSTSSTHCSTSSQKTSPNISPQSVNSSKNNSKITMF